VRGRASALDALQRAGRYEWGSWCGVGANAFGEPQDQLLMLLLLELGQLELARGALVDLAFQEALTRSVGEDAEGSDTTWHRLAARLGVDWESLALGSLLDGYVTGGLEIAARGTEQGARLLLAALELPAPDEDAGLIGDDVTAIAALAALVRPSDRCSFEQSSSRDELREAADLPPDVELSGVTVTLSGPDRTRTVTDTPDAMGRLALDHDLFVDPRAPVAWIEIETPDIDQPHQATWFRARFPVPRHLSEPTQLPVETQALTLVLPSRNAGACADGSCRVRLEAEAQLVWSEPAASEEAEQGEEPEEDDAYRYFEAIAAERTLEVDAPFGVKVVRGQAYRAVVERGGASWESPVVVPAGAPTTIVLRGDRLRSLEELISEAAEVP
jgi:hypothetical protein